MGGGHNSNIICIYQYSTIKDVGNTDPGSLRPHAVLTTVFLGPWPDPMMKTRMSIVAIAIAWGGAKDLPAETRQEAIATITSYQELMPMGLPPAAPAVVMRLMNLMQ